MSIKSRAKQEKRPSGDPKRVRGARPKPAPLNFTDFAISAHKAVVANNKIVVPKRFSKLPVPGAFGGSKITRLTRKVLKLARLKTTETRDTTQKKA